MLPKNDLKVLSRLLTKELLGWLSYLTIHSNAERRAIHDMTASSVMIDVRAARQLATAVD